MTKRQFVVKIHAIMTFFNLYSALIDGHF